MDENLPEFPNRQELLLAGETASNMRSAMLWSKFIAIIGLVTTGMWFVLSIIFLFSPMGFLYDYMPDDVVLGMMSGTGHIVGIVYLIIAAVKFFLSFFLFMASVKIKRSIDHGENLTLLQGTRNLKYYFQMQGILYIVSIGFTLIGFMMLFIFIAAFI